MKRKRPKLLDQLLNTNWSKLSQQISNLEKLYKNLLVSDLNFIDEKTCQTPLNLVISSAQINSTASNLSQAYISNCSSNLTSNNSSSSLSSLHSSPSIRQNWNPLSPLTSNNNTSHNDNSNTQFSSNQGSLFSLQCQSSGLSYSQLLSTSSSDIISSKAPLVERIIQLMIKAGAQIEFQNSDAQTALHVAAIKSNYWALKTLLDLGATTDCLDSNGLTPLYYSVIHKAELKVTQLLLSHQINYTYQHNNFTQSQAISQYTNGNSAYSNNTSNNHNNHNHNHNYTYDQVYGIGIRDQHGWQEVHHACKLGLDAHLEKLLYYGCDINAKIAGSGNTPLHVAAINDQINCAKILLLRGADKTITNSSHQTAHQVAVISGNMDLAEFISEHTSSQVVPFKDRPTDFIRGFGASIKTSSSSSSTATATATTLANNFSTTSLPIHAQANKTTTVNGQHKYSTDNLSELANRSLNNVVVANNNNNNITNTNADSLARNVSTRSALVGSQSSFQLRNSNSSSSQRLFDNSRLQRLSSNGPYQQTMTTNSQPTTTTTTIQQKLLSPLSVELMNTETLDSFPTLSSNSSRGSLTKGQTTSLLPLQIERGELNNVSPCLSQRSFATSNTTSSSGVCMDGDGNNSANEESHLPSSLFMGSNNINQKQLSNSISQHSNVTVISIGHQGPPSLANSNSNMSSLSQIDHDHEDVKSTHSNESDTSTESSCTDLYSLMLNERPLLAGNLVEAMSDYQSGDPSHLQLRRGDIIEILDFTPDLLHEGRMPILANKPMLYGQLISSNKMVQKGLFPSFCVRRTKSRHGHARKPQASNSSSKVSINQTSQPNSNVESRPTLMTESQSMIELDQTSQRKLLSNSSDTRPRSSFKEFSVTLNKKNDGFGFVLRGAKIDPSLLAVDASRQSLQIGDSPTLPQPGSRGPGHIAINEQLMEKNNLASLQYLDEIEPHSVADLAGLRRGDFLVAVNGQDVRLKSHEQVVKMIRESGNQVSLTIASMRFVPKPMASVQPAYASKTLGRVKPEPPKRNPTTTLSRNKSTIRQIANDIVPEQEDHHSLASTVSPQNTPTHSSSSTSIMTTVDARAVAQRTTEEHNQISKPELPPKPVYGVTAPIQQPIYQPAVITTTTRRKQSSASSTASVTNSINTSHPPSNVANIHNRGEASVQSMPPPPPPLPDFSRSPTRPIAQCRPTQSNRRSVDETGAFSQTMNRIQLDPERLRQKRASLAAVNPLVSKESTPDCKTSSGRTELGSVAAACAAAANDRMQRQREGQNCQEKPVQNFVAEKSVEPKLQQTIIPQQNALPSRKLRQAQIQQAPNSNNQNQNQIISQQVVQASHEQQQYQIQYQQHQQQLRIQQQLRLQQQQQQLQLDRQRQCQQYHNNHRHHHHHHHHHNHSHDHHHNNNHHHQHQQHQHQLQQHQHQQQRHYHPEQQQIAQLEREGDFLKFYI